jgi:hypothetical protein
VICDASGIPLLVCTGPANQRDEQMLEPMLKQMPMLPDDQGKRRKKPRAVQGDRAYGFLYIIKMVVRMMIISLLAPRGSPHGSGLGNISRPFTCWPRASFATTASPNSSEGSSETAS